MKGRKDILDLRDGPTRCLEVVVRRLLKYRCKLCLAGAKVRGEAVETRQRVRERPEEEHALAWGELAELWAGRARCEVLGDGTSGGHRPQAAREHPDLPSGH